MRLHDIAYARAGEKCDVSNICVFPYDPADLPLLEEQLTVDVVKAKFGPLVRGEVRRYAVPGLAGLNFVMTGAMDGGCTLNLRVDTHAKTYQSLMLDIDLGPSSRAQPGTISGEGGMTA